MRLALIWLTALGLSSSLCYGDGNISSGGGDELRMIVNRTRAMAVGFVRSVSDRMIPPSIPRRMAALDWIVANREALAADILDSPHAWSEEAGPTCAHTEFRPLSPIQFFFPTCRDSLFDRRAVARVLIHESAHHLGVEDEMLADAIAMVAVDSQTSMTYVCSLDLGNGSEPATATHTITAPGGTTFFDLQAGSFTMDVALSYEGNSLTLADARGGSSQAIARPLDGALFAGSQELKLNGATAACEARYPDDSVEHLSSKIKK